MHRISKGAGSARTITSLSIFSLFRLTAQMDIKPDPGEYDVDGANEVYEVEGANSCCICWMTTIGADRIMQCSCCTSNPICPSCFSHKSHQTCSFCQGNIYVYAYTDIFIHIRVLAVRPRSLES